MKIIQMLDDTEHGILPFQLKDLMLWINCVEKNRSDPYGHSVNRFASRWANLIEKKMSEGQPLTAALVESTEDESTNGEDVRIGYALSILSRVWAYGELLVQLHPRGKDAVF